MLIGEIPLAVGRHDSFWNNANLFCFLQAHHECRCRQQAQRDITPIECQIELYRLNGPGPGIAGQGQVIALSIVVNIQADVRRITSTANLPRVATKSCSVSQPSIERLRRIRFNFQKTIIPAICMNSILLFERPASSLLVVRYIPI